MEFLYPDKYCSRTQHSATGESGTRAASSRLTGVTKLLTGGKMANDTCTGL